MHVEKFPNTAQVKVATFEDPRQISKQRILFLRAACCIVNVEYRPCSAFLMASQFLIMEEIILIFVTNLSKLYLLPHPDVDGRWQQALERGLGHQGGAEGSGGQNLGFQTQGGNRLPGAQQQSQEGKRQNPPFLGLWLAMRVNINDLKSD